MALPELKKDEKYTVGHYLEWPDDERWELIDGTPHLMSPAPSPDHQEVVGELYRQVSNYLREMEEEFPCRPFVAPIDVFLPEEHESIEESNTVLQPDLVVVCDPEQVTPRGIVGPPRWVIEVLSPSTSKRDQSDKRAVYERHGVEEYWLVHPGDRLVQIYRPDEQGRYGKPQVSETEGTLDSGLFDGLGIDWDEVFARVTPRG